MVVDRYGDLLAAVKDAIRTVDPWEDGEETLEQNCTRQGLEDIAHRAIRAARPLILEEAAKVLDRRAAMYREKAAEHTILAEDTLTEHERFTSNAEATEWGAQAIRSMGGSDHG